MTIEEVHKKQRHLTYKQPKLKDAALRYASQLTTSQTPAEAFFQSLLVESNIVFEDQKIILGTGVFWIPDFYLPDYHIIVELDGNHHYTPEGLIKDSERDSMLANLGFDKIIRIPNNKVFILTKESLLNILTISK